MTLLLLDANGLMHRAHHSTKANPQYRDDTLPVTAIGRFLDLVYEALIDVGRPQCATHAAAIFDAPGPNWRHDIAPTYKSGRSHDPDFHPQLRLCRDLVKGLGISSVQQRGYEADDLIATYARLAEEQGMSTCVVSIDKDIGQLLRPGVSIYNPMRRRLAHGHEEFFPFGSEKDHVMVRPAQIPCLQGMMGDSVDGFSGIRNVGPKKAAALLERFGSLDAIIAGAAEIAQPALRASITAGADQARACRRLAILDDAVPVRRDLEDLELRRADPDLLIGGLKSLGLIHWPGVFGERLQVDPADFPPHAGITELSDELVEFASA